MLKQEKLYSLEIFTSSLESEDEFKSIEHLIALINIRNASDISWQSKTLVLDLDSSCNRVIIYLSAIQHLIIKVTAKTGENWTCLLRILSTMHQKYSADHNRSNKDHKDIISAVKKHITSLFILIIRESLKRRHTNHEILSCITGAVLYEKDSDENFPAITSSLTENYILWLIKVSIASWKIIYTKPKKNKNKNNELSKYMDNKEVSSMLSSRFFKPRKTVTHRDIKSLIDNNSNTYVNLVLQHALTITQQNIRNEFLNHMIDLDINSLIKSIIDISEIEQPLKNNLIKLNNRGNDENNYINMILQLAGIFKSLSKIKKHSQHHLLSEIIKYCGAHVGISEDSLTKAENDSPKDIEDGLVIIICKEVEHKIFTLSQLSKEKKPNQSATKDRKHTLSLYTQPSRQHSIQS